jgi:hypothetical protein
VDNRREAAVAWVDTCGYCGTRIRWAPPRGSRGGRFVETATGGERCAAAAAGDEPGGEHWPASAWLDDPRSQTAADAHLPVLVREEANGTASVVDRYGDVIGTFTDPHAARAIAHGYQVSAPEA